MRIYAESQRLKPLESSNKQNKNNTPSFNGEMVALHKVQNSNAFKKILPTIAFASSIVGATGYLIGATGLFYDIRVSKKKKPKFNDNNLKSFNDLKNKLKNHNDDGVKTITAETEFGKFAIKCARTAVAATATAGMACGIGEGVPLMAIGEATNFASARIIETPIGTGLFGLGIASIFAGLALDNTPELKLNELDLMAEKNLAKKWKMIGKNMLVTGKEISLSIFQIMKNIFNKKFLKENIFQGTPKTLVISEAINKDGKIILTKALRHNKNYVMHAASFTLGVGGISLVITKLLNQKKAQTTSLKVEEAGFLFDNFGITRYGLDKITTNGKSAGASFAIGGVLNAISQFLGLDNKDGRALQWLGISGVFIGYAIDRGKHLKSALAKAKERPELTRVIREWKINLNELIKDNPQELKKLLKQLKKNETITNQTFIDFENNFNSAINAKYLESPAAKQSIEGKLNKDIADKIQLQEVLPFEKAKEILKACTIKIFGSENPSVVRWIEKKQPLGV